MADEIITHEWRLRSLEARMEKLESKIQSAMYILVGNLTGVIVLLIKAMFFSGAAK